MLTKISATVDERTRRQWGEVYRRYRPMLRPNKRPAEEMLAWLRRRCPTVRLRSEQMAREAAFNARQHLRLFGEPGQQDPGSHQILVLRVERRGAGEELYRTQQRDFAAFLAEMRAIYPDARDISPGDFPLPILVFAELSSGYMSVEGSPRLLRELVAWQGLSRRELDNPYLVAQYVDALRRTGRLEEVLRGSR